MLDRREFLGAVAGVAASVVVPAEDFDAGVVCKSFPIGPLCVFVDWFRAEAVAGDETGKAQMRYKVKDGPWLIANGTYFPKEKLIEFPGIEGETITLFWGKPG